MATETKNLKLNKPETTDFYNIAAQNENMDKIDEAIAGKANKTDIPSIPDSMPAKGGDADTVGGKLPSAFAPASHNHDDRYYTESEMDIKLGAKANTGHSHTKSDIGLGNVDNTADANKSVNYANSAGSANNATNAGNADTVDGWHMNLAIGDWGIKPICAGTGDMVAGTTGLSQGHVYIVYE